MGEHGWEIPCAAREFYAPNVRRSKPRGERVSRMIRPVREHLNVPREESPMLMTALIWVMTGAVAGWLAGKLMKGRDYWPGRQRDPRVAR